jgi:DNA-binding PadR family transcriptional regulator
VSKIYEEPKKLVAHGLATAVEEPVGRRTRTRYAITSQGRQALAEWHREPGAGPVLEFEQLLKLAFAEHGTTADASATVAAARAWAVERNAENLATARAYLAGEAQFQHRLPQNVLAGRFLTDFYRMVAEWSDWAADVVSDWPDAPADAVVDPAELREIVRRADW